MTGGADDQGAFSHIGNAGRGRHFGECERRRAARAMQRLAEARGGCDALALLTVVAVVQWQAATRSAQRRCQRRALFGRCSDSARSAMREAALRAAAFQPIRMARSNAAPWN